MRDELSAWHDYQQLGRKPDAVDFDPWEWARKSPDYSNVNAYNAYHQLDHGKRLQEMVLFEESELMEALFSLRISAILQCMSWSELEYSYGLHLRDIINHLASSKCDNAIGCMDSDVTSVIIEIGRFFTELDYSNRPKSFHEGNIADPVGPFVNGPWSEDMRQKYTLNELHHRCHGKELIKDWEGNDIIRIVFDSVSASVQLSAKLNFCIYWKPYLLSIEADGETGLCESSYPTKRGRCSYSISLNSSTFRIHKRILSSPTIRPLQPVISISRR